MTGTDKTRFPIVSRSFKPERLGGSFLFRAPYLESRWVRAVFKTLVLCTAAMLILAAVTSRFAGWQAGYRAEVMAEARADWSESLLAEQSAEESGSLTGEAAALEAQLTALSRQLFFLPEDSALRSAQQRAEEELFALMVQVSGRYEEAKAQYRAGDPLGALESFLTVQGYNDADGWISLANGRLRRESRRSWAKGDTLTAWVRNVRLLGLMAPEKLPAFQQTFAALRGVWICHEDFRTAALPADTGDGRAGGGAVRCLKAEGTGLYGGIGYGAPLDLEALPFTALLASGGVEGVSGGENRSGPEGVILSLPDEGVVTEIRVVSENIIEIPEGGWKGRYYRVLGSPQF